MGYFELEQRLDVATAEGGGGSAASSGATSGGGGISITLKVYGDVWRWLADDKVCSLREQVVEARFSLVHVTSVARKATKIAQVSTTRLGLGCRLEPPKGIQEGGRRITTKG